MIEIFQAETAEHIEETRRLFREYEQWLALDLCFQNFEEELKNLPGKYAAPDGRLFLIAVDDAVAGCGALRKLEPRVCEMKRLFVREDFRGLNLGRILIEKLLTEARLVGCERMRLDTLPEKMPRAVKLYQSFGFREIAPYYKNPHAQTLFLELDLNKQTLQGRGQTVAPANENEICHKSFVSYLKQKTTRVRLVSSVIQNALDGRHLSLGQSGERLRKNLEKAEDEQYE